MEGPLYFSPELRGKRGKSAVQEDEITGRVFGTLKALSPATRMSILANLDIVPSPAEDVELKLWPDLMDVEPDVLIYSRGAPVTAIECKWGLDPTAKQLAREARVGQNARGFRLVLITRRTAPVDLEDKYLRKVRDVPLILKRWRDVYESFLRQRHSTTGLERSILDEAIAFMRWKGMRPWEECMGHFDEEMHDGRVCDALDKLHGFFREAYKQIPRILGTNYNDIRRPHYGYTDRSWILIRPEDLRKTAVQPKDLRKIVEHLQVCLSYTPREFSWELTLETHPKARVKQLVRALSGERIEEMELNVPLEGYWILSREIDDCVDYSEPANMMDCLTKEIVRFNKDAVNLLKQLGR